MSDKDKGKRSDEGTDHTDEKDAQVESLKELGYDSLDALAKDVSSLKKQINDSQEMISRQKDEIGKLREVATSVAEEGEKSKGERKVNEEPERKEEESEEEKFNRKAKKLYNSLSAEEVQEIEKQVQELPDEIKALGKTAEGRYALLKQFAPETKKENDGKGFFGDLAEQPKQKSLTEQLEDAMSRLKGGVTAEPIKKGSGFGGTQQVIGKPAEPGRAAEKPDVFVKGLYPG